METENSALLCIVIIIISLVLGAVVGNLYGIEEGKKQNMEMVNDLLNCYDWSCVFENNSIDVGCTFKFIENWMVK